MESHNEKLDKCSGSIVFRRSRVIGYVSNNIRAATRYVQRRKDTLIATCIGRAFQVYTASHCRLIHISDIHPDNITAMAVDRTFIYTASNKCIFVWRAGKEIKFTLRGHMCDIHSLLPFGNHLIAIDESNILKVWEVRKEEVYLEMPFNVEEFQITAIVHPPTYLNKVLLGSRQGQLQLWNLHNNTLLYTFTGHNSRVTVLEAAPAIDVVAVGHHDGLINLLNLKYDELIMNFKQDWGAVTQISFRTDGPPIMATACDNGYIAFWNLEEKKIAHQLQAHEDSITTTICFPNEPLILTTSPDNSLKLWICDLPDGSPRLLKIREGHTAPPLYIRYYGADGTTILSAGEDSSIMVFSTISESLHKSMGKASYNRKVSKKKNRFQYDKLRMPPILAFTSETTREKQWDNIAAIHAGIIQTTTWSFDRSCMGTHRIVPEKFHNKNRTDFNTETTCLMLTHCGNFVIIGYSSGDVERFNIQSGIHRATYGSPAHKGAIRGVASDNLNQYVVTGCSDGLLKFWLFKVKDDNKEFEKLNFDSGITLIAHHRESSMLAVGLENFSIKIVDCDTRSIIRKFEGHSGKINDMTWSPDSRWLISAAMDSIIKVWDIPSSYMIDHFKVQRVCISLSMSPCGIYLATAHVNSLGIYLWCNKTLFANVSLRSLNPNSDAPYIDLTQHLSKVVDTEQENIEESVAKMCIGCDDEYGNEVNFIYNSPAQLATNLITLSNLPESRWQNLLDWDVIRERNKPKTTLKVNKQTPFFLPTVAGLDMKFDVIAGIENGDEMTKNKSKILEVKTLSNLTIFGKHLEESATSGNFEKSLEFLKNLGPSMINFEIKSLNPLNGGTTAVMIQFLKLIIYMFTTNKNFDLANAYLSVFLRFNGLNLLDMPDVMDVLENVEKVQAKYWEKLENDFLYGISVVSTIKNYAPFQ